MAVATFYPSANSGDWTNGGNLYADDGVYCECSPAQYATLTHSVWDFGFNIPSGSTINVVTVSVERKLNSSASNGVFYFRVLKNNANYGTEFNTTGEPIADTVYSSTESGIWTADELNVGGDTGFKVYIREYRASSSNAKTCYVDYIKVDVDYTPPAVTSIKSFAQII